MAGFPRLVGTELWRMSKSSLPRGLLLCALLLSLCVSLVPTLVLGNEQTYGFAAFPRGLVVGASASLLAGPIIALFIVGSEYDRGTRDARFLAGQSPFVVTLAQTCTALSVAILFAICTGLLSAIGGMGDQLRRAILGPHAPVRAFDWTSATTIAVLLASAILVTMMTAALTAALRSGTRAAIVLSVTLGSWLFLLAIYGRPGVHQIVGLHPFALPWYFLSGSNDRVPAADPVMSVASTATILWLVLLLVSASKGARTPTKR